MSRGRRIGVVATAIGAVIGAAINVRAVPAQSPSTSVLSSTGLGRIREATSIAELSAHTLCDSLSSDPKRLCDALVAERRSELTQRRGDAIAAQAQLERAVVDDPHSPVAWYGLGLIRLQLARDTVFSKGGALMPVGVSFVAGAGNALVQALKLDSAFAPAAMALATAPEPREGSSALKDRVAMLRRCRAALSPAAMVATARLERDAGSVDSAVALENRALVTGRVDSGVVSVGLARDLYRLGRSDEGRAVLLRGSAIPTAAADSSYRAALAWVASPRELASWDTVPPSRRSKWLAAFWARRDVAAGLDDGGALVEHYRRFEYAMAHYRITPPETGTESFGTFAAGGLLSDEDDARRLAMTYPECFPEESRLASESELIGADSPLLYFHSGHDEVDDRGVVYIRLGPPDQRTSTITGDPVEIWQYDRPDGPLILQFRYRAFQGTTGAGTLVPSVLSMPADIRNQVCAIDQSLCSGSTRVDPLTAPALASYQPPGCGTTFTGFNAGLAKVASILNTEVTYDAGRVGLSALVRARDAGRQAIDRATTTDAYGRKFAHLLGGNVAMYGLSRFGGVQPRLIAAFALDGNSLASFRVSRDSAGVYYPLDIEVIAARSSDGERSELRVHRQFVATAPLASGQYLTQFVELPLPAGSYTASVVFTQPGDRGALAHVDSVGVPGGSARLTISSIVLGRPDDPLQWNSDSTAVELNPLATFPAGGTAEVYYQIGGLDVDSTYDTRLAVYDADAAAGSPPRLTLSFHATAQRTWMETSQKLGLAQLKPGAYLLRVSVTSGGESAMASAPLVVLK